MDPLQKNIATARAEAMAANMLATAAIQLALGAYPDKERVLKGLSAWVDVSLNQSHPNKGDANDEFNTFLRETARFMVEQALDNIALNFRPHPNA